MHHRTVYSPPCLANYLWRSNSKSALKYLDIGIHHCLMAIRQTAPIASSMTTCKTPIPSSDSDSERIAEFLRRFNEPGYRGVEFFIQAGKNLLSVSLTPRPDWYKVILTNVSLNEKARGKSTKVRDRHQRRSAPTASHIMKLP